jgi:aromatic-amino-acid transaminase
MKLNLQAEATRLGGIFDTLAPQPEDALLGLIGRFRGDQRLGKIDLGVGVYKAETGSTPVMRAVKGAEELLVAQQESKSYLGAEGDQIFTDRLATIAFGSEIAARDRLTGVQTPGGTGALRLGAELLKAARPHASVWMGTPTWPNHAPIFRSAGLSVREHRFYDVATGKVDFDAMCADLTDASAGDVILLHGCCHNPTGAPLTSAEWRTLTELCQERGLVPFIDLAYQGLGDGLEADAAATRHLLADLPTALVAYSCDKNFGLYRDRVGALWVQAATVAQAHVVRGNILARARVMWSMPPDHGAAIVRLILQNDGLHALWNTELDGMRVRLNAMRELLAASHSRLRGIGRQRGMFAMLPLDTHQVTALRDGHAIYMPANGRINIAGLTVENIPRLAAALTPYL